MNLYDYAISEGGTGTVECPVLTRVALRAGCSHHTLYMIARGHKAPSAKLANRIEEGTNFHVSRQTLRPDVFGPARNSKSRAA